MAAARKPTKASDLFGLYAAGPGASGMGGGSTYIFPEPFMGGTTAPAYPTPFTPPVTIGPAPSKPVPSKKDDSHNLERIATALEAIVDRFC